MLRNVACPSERSIRARPATCCAAGSAGVLLLGSQPPTRPPPPLVPRVRPPCRTGDIGIPAADETSQLWQTYEHCWLEAGSVVGVDTGTGHCPASDVPTTSTSPLNANGRLSGAVGAWSGAAGQPAAARCSAAAMLSLTWHVVLRYRRNEVVVLGAAPLCRAVWVCGCGMRTPPCLSSSRVVCRVTAQQQWRRR